MPVSWTREAVQTLFPIRLGIGRSVVFRRSQSGAMLTYFDKAQPRDFPATVQGWVSLWSAISGTAKGDKVAWAKSYISLNKRVMVTPFRDAEAALRADSLGRLILPGLVFLGGAGHVAGLRSGQVVDLRLSSEELLLTCVEQGTAVWSAPVRQVVEANASGPGATIGGGFAATVGHGLVGDLLEQASAQWMTDRYGTKTVTTFVRLVTDTSELFLRSMTESPEVAQIALSSVRASARGTLAERSPEEAGSSDDGLETSSGDDGGAPLPDQGQEADDLVSRLERLARLRGSGALSDSEYERAKAKLLS